MITETSRNFIFFTLSFFIIGLSLCSVNATTQKTVIPYSNLTLWYNTPAPNWNSALPMGNGRLGAMIYGGGSQEHIQFNEDSIWTGVPHDYSHPDAAKHLSTIRQLLWDGKQKEAEKLAMNKFMSIPLRQKSYQPCGKLIIDFKNHDNLTNYQRSLNLEMATHHVTYKIGETTFQRESFASFPDQAGFSDRRLFPVLLCVISNIVW